MFGAGKPKYSEVITVDTNGNLKKGKIERKTLEKILEDVKRDINSESISKVELQIKDKGVMYTQFYGNIFLKNGQVIKLGSPDQPLKKRSENFRYDSPDAPNGPTALGSTVVQGDKLIPFYANIKNNKSKLFSVRYSSLEKVKKIQVLNDKYSLVRSLNDKITNTNEPDLVPIETKEIFINEAYKPLGVNSMNIKGLVYQNYKIIEYLKEHQKKREKAKSQIDKFLLKD